MNNLQVWYIHHPLAMRHDEIYTYNSQNKECLGNASKRQSKSRTMQESQHFIVLCNQCADTRNSPLLLVSLKNAKKNTKTHNLLCRWIWVGKKNFAQILAEILRTWEKPHSWTNLKENKNIDDIEIRKPSMIKFRTSWKYPCCARDVSLFYFLTPCYLPWGGRFPCAMR